MTSIYTTEYETLAMDINGNYIAAGLEPAIAEQKDTVDGTSDKGNAFNKGTRFVLVHVDGITHVRFGATGLTVDATSARMPADSSRFFGVIPEQFLYYITGT